MGNRGADLKFGHYICWPAGSRRYGENGARLRRRPLQVEEFVGADYE